MKLYTLTGPDGKPYPSATPGTLGGYSRGKTKIYGQLDCQSALGWIERGKSEGKPFYVPYRVFFKDEATAMAAGFRPCGVCMRDRYAQWKCGELPDNKKPDNKKLDTVA